MSAPASLVPGMLAEHHVRLTALLGPWYETLAPAIATDVGLLVLAAPRTSSVTAALGSTSAVRRASDRFRDAGLPTPKQLLDAFRGWLARACLRDGALVRTTADALHISSPQHFDRWMRRLYGGGPRTVATAGPLPLVSDPTLWIVTPRRRRHAAHV